MDIQMLDVRSAYLCAELDIPNYMTPPRGIKPPKPGQVMKLVRPLYGTRQGASEMPRALQRSPQMEEQREFVRTFVRAVRAQR